jgi:kumamolisin
MNARHGLIIPLVAASLAADFSPASASPHAGAISTLWAPRVPGPAADVGRYAGPMPGNASVALYIALPGRHQAEIASLIDAQNTPGSPLYHRYLTPAEYGSYFGAEPAALARALASLRAHGFAIDRLAANRRDVEVHAPASVVSAFFNAPLDIRSDGTRTFYAARYEPALPPDFAGAAIGGLESYHRFHPHHRFNPAAQIGGQRGWAPPDIQSTYSLTPIYASATGAGITVIDATVGFARASDFTTFTGEFGSSATLISTAVGSKKPPLDNNGETTIDVEWISGVAPGATIDQVSPANASNKDFDSMYSYIVNDMSTVHIVTTSWGDCEQDVGNDLNLDESLFQQAYTEGQWWLAAAGDDGADDCADGKKSVDFPGSSPYVVSVGGTEVTPQSTSGGNYTGWKKEVTWDKGGASGGGASIEFSKPNFQTALTPKDGARDVPDVALMADDYDVNGGYLIYYRGDWQSGWGGTSFASPMWAGFFSLIAQAQGGTIPSPLVTLYQLGGTTSYGSLFHDITKGCNTYRNVQGYCAAKGYDQTTGLGSFIGSSLEAAY